MVQSGNIENNWQSDNTILLYVQSSNIENNWQSDNTFILYGAVW